MPMTYAGFPLTLMTEFLFPRFQRWWEENAPDLWSYPGYALEGMHHLPVPDRPKTPTKARLNTLYWPTGASRWGIFHGLVDNATLTAIQALTGGVTGTPPTPQVLFLQGATGETPVNASMYLLNVRPIFVNGFQNLLWITLVDKRYYYWLKRPTYTFVDGDSWEDLILALSSAAGSPTPTISTIPAAYGTPTFERWNLIGKPLPILMDAAARQVGLRYIISLDGTTADFVNYTTAQANAVLQYELCQVTAPSPRIVLGGRNGPITSPLALGSVQSLIGNVPANVTVQFWGDTKADYVAVNVSLASLALSEYSGLSGVSGAYGVWMADQKEDVVSPTQSAYATQAATDYYLWLLSLNDFTVTSIFPFESGGLEDRIEWEYCSIRESVSPGAMGAARIGVGIREARETDVGLTAPIRVLTRIVPLDWHDNATYGGGPPPITSVCEKEVELTSVWSPTTGYSWKQLRSVSMNWVDTSPLIEGENALSFVSDKTLLPGTQGWLECDPTNPNTFSFIHCCGDDNGEGSGSGSGSGSGPNPNDPCRSYIGGETSSWQSCIDGRLYQYSRPWTDYWDATACPPIIRIYGVTTTEVIGCCACQESGSGSGSGEGSGSGSGSGSGGDCSQCATLPANGFTFSIIKLTEPWAALNGSWTMTHAGGCLWISGPPSPLWRLEYVGGAWQLVGTTTYRNRTYVVTFTVSGSFACCGETEFSVDTAVYYQGDSDMPVTVDWGQSTTTITVTGEDCEANEPVAVPCYADPVPRQLFITFLNATGDCVGSLTGSYALNWNYTGPAPEDGFWETIDFPCLSCTTPGTTDKWYLACNPFWFAIGSYSAIASPPFGTNPPTTTSAPGDPFELTFIGVVITGGTLECSPGGGTVDIIITE